MTISLSERNYSDHSSAAKIPARRRHGRLQEIRRPSHLPGCSSGASGPFHPAGEVRQCQQVLRIPDPPTRAHLLATVSRCALDEDAISNSAWYALGLQMLSRCEELRILGLDGWEDSVGVTLETRYARQLRIPVSVADPSTYEVQMLHSG